MKKVQTTYQFLSGRQSRILTLLVSLLVCSALFFATANSINGRTAAQAAQKSATGGEWLVIMKANKPGDVHITFHRQREKGSLMMTSADIPLGELKGLTPDTESSTEVEVNFNIAREAGIFACEGFFRQGKGAGFWTFTPSRSFVSAARSRGYEDLSEEDLLRAALHNLTIKLIDDLKSVGYERVEFTQLLRAASRDITPQFIREMHNAGYQNLSIEELIRARNHNINGEYVKEVRAMGFDKQPIETLIRLRNHKITGEFIQRAKTKGFTDLSLEQLIRLRNQNIVK